jgi:hypothetical protein
MQICLFIAECLPAALAKATKDSFNRPDRKSQWLSVLLIGGQVEFQ